MRNDGTQVRLQRERLGLTKTELARRLGVTPSAVSQYENSITLREGVIKKLQTVFGSDWSPDRDVWVLAHGIDAVMALLKERGVTVRIEGKLIYLLTT